MQILSHRGYWKSPDEKNSLVAFLRSFELGFGTETDIRDFNGQLVISHDIPNASAIPASQFFEAYRKIGNPLPLALNIKADGLADLLRLLLIQYEITNYFVFDMSIPDTLGYAKAEMSYFTRQSEYEPVPALLEGAAGVWMDLFISDWITPDDITIHLAAGRKVCLVSPELHKRPHLPFWNMLRESDITLVDELMLCTDFYESAREFFI